MTSVDAGNSGQLIARLSPFFTDIAAECPYGLDCTAVYHQAGFGSFSSGLLEAFLDGGYRRNGNTLYAMRCQGCTACVPIRLDIGLFRPSRNMRRVRQRNLDVEIKAGPLEMTEEKLRLLDRFLNSRYPGRGSTALDYYRGFFLNSLVPTMDITYRLSGRLVGVSVVDLAERSLSAVYFYFDPDFERRSPGTLNILFLAELAKREGYGYLYLGYWIEPVAAMAYKARFRPHFLLIDGRWRLVD